MSDEGGSGWRPDASLLATPSGRPVEPGDELGGRDEPRLLDDDAPAEEDDEPDWGEVAKRFAQKERLDEDPPSSSPDAVPRPNGTER